jgi:hypothetical protein
MYVVKAIKSAARMGIARTGVRRRRNPVIVMSDGSAIKITPGRSIVITDDVYKANKNLLKEYADRLSISKLASPVNDTRIEPVTEQPPPVPAEPVDVEVQQPDNEVVAESVPKPVDPEPIEADPTPVLEAEPVVEEVKPAPKTRRKRTNEVATEVAVEEAKPKRRRKSKKAST